MPPELLFPLLGCIGVGGSDCSWERGGGELKGVSAIDLIRADAGIT